MRGEKPFKISKHKYVQGSPPHARGKEVHTFNGFRVAGITPACAGKRTSRAPMWPAMRDHPRMRGEKVAEQILAMDAPGSPPHARGKATVYLWQRDPLRITPACAGKREKTLYSYLQMEDHPRMRGEKLCIHLFSHIFLGSPPHARGKAVLPCHNPGLIGITPACAGKRH